MAEFKAQNKKAVGRPRGSKNAKTLLPKKLTDEALKQLESKVKDGDLTAITFTLNRIYPSLKATATGAELGLVEAQTELAHFKVKELGEFQARLDALEQANK